MAENSQGDREAAAVQIPCELPSIYRWVTNDVLGTPSSLDQQYLDELKLTRVLFGGGDLEHQYRVEAAWRGERVCFLNLDHPTVLHWLWANKVMFTEFGIRVPFSDFQQRLLNRASVAPSQLHPNAWSSIRYFELVTEFLELPQDPEVFLYLFKLYSSNTSGKTKKGYMSDRPGKGRNIFGLYEDSFHDFKGRYFKIFSVGDHRLFWLSLEGDGLFLPYWSDQAGFDVARLRINGLTPISMADNNVTLSRLRNLLRPPQAGSVPQARVAYAASGFSCLGRVSTTPVIPVPKNRAIPERGSSNETRRGQDHLVDVSSPLREEELRRPSPKKCPAEEGVVGSKRPRVSKGGSREFSAMDRSFDASGFIAANLLGRHAQEALRDYDAVESVRWAEWAMLRDASILKSVELRLTVADEVERRNAKFLGDLKALDLQKLVIEEEKADAVAAKLKAEGELRSAEAKLETLAKEKDREIE
ncbi:hypothetical protein PIB30_051781 [Stylosanthes scabra]|uniref:Transposase (putative) gypsy type domain-containing protein n=1 Tax=Stylosanthes scabra TaxID=79078 RepID=A0ABU6ZGU4_9FABA|nr:hypothetical protein [Stylosanthes scabra]